MEQLQEIENQLERNQKELEEIKNLLKNSQRVQKRDRDRLKSEIQKTLDRVLVKRLKLIESLLAANSLAIELLFPPILLGVLLLCKAGKIGVSIDYIKLIQNPQKEISRVLSPNVKAASGDYSDNTKLIVGMSIEGFQVTSGMGKRVAPVPGASTDHKGVDLATPIGTPLYGIGKIDVTCRYQSEGAGHYALVDYPNGSKNFVFMHLSECKTGTFYRGQVFAKTGDTGIGSGAHLHMEQYIGINLENPTVGYARGFLNPDYSSSDEMTRAIGHAEGTLDSSGNKTKYWKTHTDPGNSARNQGTFSYQHSAKSPEEADQKQKEKLKKFEKELIQEASSKAYKLSKIELMNGLDLYNQSETATIGYIDRLIKYDQLVPELRILNARIYGYYKPNGKLDAPGLGNSFKTVHADQLRRYKAIEKVLKKS